MTVDEVEWQIISLYLYSEEILILTNVLYWS